MATSPAPAQAPVFISYSRRDYYFAESRALHLMQHRIPAWLNVKDLTPGVSPNSLLSVKDKLATLTTKKIWRTFWCLAAYMMCWAWLLGMLDN